ncbi:Cyclic di-GMP phosphodiesterase response regulator RpfG [Hartmannibacter diazotrophicus]|uniref:Cyclic di-GMP phosphodiesterase response regulator RpfG n=2 Tax=Hartmannibacter diazotrophicus TaxID=1482074 RepID=A0A2C9D2F7_9HYPH|nr:Cyclic di-GMP phosphodiesterase response regulator RpfG [Hartmannibacter diazotrophicus]
MMTTFEPQAARLPSCDEPCHILIVEDDVDDMKLLQNAFATAAPRCNVRVRCHGVANGFEAINFMTWHDVVDDLPDFIVLDLNMPVIDGIGFLRTLRNSLEFGGIRVIVLTTSNEEDVHRQALEAGADEVCVKPDTRRELIEIAGRMIGVSCGTRSSLKNDDEIGIPVQASSAQPLGHVPFQPVRAGAAGQRSVIELQALKLRDGIEEAEFLAAVNAATEFLKTCPGFIRRRLARGAADEWVDYLEWASSGDAREAARRGRHAAGMKAFLSVVEETSPAGPKLLVPSTMN